MRLPQVEPFGMSNTAGIAAVVKSRVVAVVVTYNRSGLLQQCLEAVLGQTRPPDAVVVVDNASTDRTSEVLEAYADRVVRIRMRFNVGGAGGFHRGMRWAFENGADWLWLMDDDGIPALDGLEVMLQPAYAGTLSLMNPVVVSLDDAEDLSFGIGVDGIQTRSVPFIWSALKGGDVLPKQINPFNGTMLSRDLVARIGFPRREMFIWGDEVDYTNRVAAAGLPLGTVLRSVHRHPGGSKWPVGSVRLGFLGSVDITPDARIGIAARNMGYLYRQRGDLKLLLFKPVVIAGYHLFRGKFRNFNSFIRYYLDGVFDRYRLAPSRAKLFADGELYEVRTPTSLEAANSTRGNIADVAVS